MRVLRPISSLMLRPASILFYIESPTSSARASLSCTAAITERLPALEYGPLQLLTGRECLRTNELLPTPRAPTTTRSYYGLAHDGLSAVVALKLGIVKAPFMTINFSLAALVFTLIRAIRRMRECITRKWHNLKNRR